ncbi:PREDICTED: disease resistance protein TAO1-like isoform X2 [Camelina sativa]|uniref:Disease resistance protein TAO1-like isoform X2 n=1 Tax=Camelina sativa TaxID=90675 RepID=A0ABM0Z725_CAMSA|nr:PREDICTED: disease resistance protein TAO1-like isoform X2 [Camelina sativa]
MNLEEVEEYLAESFDHVKQRLHVLDEKSLISIQYNKYIRMHKMLAQLGKTIVQSGELRHRQFLLDRKDICEALIDSTTMTISVVGIYSKYQLNITEKAFERMSNLQFLRVLKHNDDHQNIISSLGALSFTSPNLRLLDWSYFPMTCLHFTNNLEFLVEFNMVNSKLEKLWDGTKLLRNLKRISLENSKNLEELPNLSTATNLKKLQLSGCSSLVELPSSIGNTTNLEKLNLSGCSSLVELPSSIGNSTNLKELDLYGCSRLVELPPFIGNATNLKELDLYGCSRLVELPSSIGNATILEKLNLGGCSSLVELPSSIGNANLTKLNFRGCSSLVKVPSSIVNATNLKELDLDGCSSLMELPSFIGNVTNLEKLNLCGCLSLVELPSSIGNLTNLEKLNLSGCSRLLELPFTIDDLRRLYLNGCSSLMELPSSIENATELVVLNLNACSSLVSLPQLPESILVLYAENCESLEKLDCYFCIPYISLQFVNCFKLNKEARDLILQRSNLESAVLPGGEIPACFTYRANVSSITVKLNQKPLPITQFKVCILFDKKGENEAKNMGEITVSCTNTSKQNSHTARILNGLYVCPVLTEHLYIFEFEVWELTSTELIFKFELYGDDFRKTWKIKKCGIIHLEHDVFIDYGGLRKDIPFHKKIKYRLG